MTENTRFQFVLDNLSFHRSQEQNMTNRSHHDCNDDFLFKTELKDLYSLDCITSVCHVWLHVTQYRVGWSPLECSGATVLQGSIYSLEAVSLLLASFLLDLVFTA